MSYQKILSVTAMTLCLSTGYGQWEKSILANNAIETTIQSNSTFFHDGGLPAFELNGSSDKHIFRYGSMWMMGIDSGNTFGSMSISSSSEELWPGPIDTVTGLPKDPFEWNQMWSVSATEVEFHKAHYRDSGYQPIEDILSWPASHSETNVSAVLAPFIDWNTDGKYNPKDGDYPNLPGVENTYFIANDGAGEHLTSGTQKLGVELQGFFYTKSDEYLQQVVYLDVFAVNRSNRNYVPFYFANYLDFELGNSSDNYCGTELIRNMVFGINGDDNDEGSMGYGTSLPAAGALSLSHPMFASIAFQKGDTVRDFPKNSSQYRNIIEGKWRNGEDKIRMGNGIGTGQASRFMYSGNSEPDFPTANWTDSSSGDPAGQRNILSIYKIESLKAKSFEKFSMAFFGFTGTDNSMETLVDIASKIIDANGGPVSSQSIASEAFVLYPNPLTSGNSIYIDGLYSAPNSVQMFTLDGRETRLEYRENIYPSKYRIQCSENVANGIYILKVRTNDDVVNKRILIQRP